MCYNRNKWYVLSDNEHIWLPFAMYYTYLRYHWQMIYLSTPITYVQCSIYPFVFVNSWYVANWWMVWPTDRQCGSQPALHCTASHLVGYGTITIVSRTLGHTLTWYHFPGALHSASIYVIHIHAVVYLTVMLYYDVLI
jgi:hypothetical protein